MNACHAFRRHLESILASATSLEARRELNWHEHLLGCSDCRDLLEGEQALDLLLESLPSPALPPFLAERVLLRLRSDTKTEALLDALLDLDAQAESPDDLGARVNAGIARRQDEALDRLLDEADSIVVPVGLGPRVHAGLLARQDEALDGLLEAAGVVDVPSGIGRRIHDELAPELRRVRRQRWMARATFYVTRGLAAVFLAAAALWLTDRLDRESNTGTGDTPLLADVELPEDGLLDVLPALELMGMTDGDSGLLIGAGLDDGDLALSELGELEAPAWEGAGR